MGGVDAVMGLDMAIDLRSGQLRRSAVEMKAKIPSRTRNPMSFQSEAHISSLSMVDRLRKLANGINWWWWKRHVVTDSIS